MARVVLCLTLAVAAVASDMAPSAAQNDPAAEAIQKELKGKQLELENAQSRAKELQSDVEEIAREREKVNARLLETAALIQKSEAQMTATEARLGELEAQEKIVKGSLAQRHDHIAKLLSALQRMGRNPPPVMITRREDALGMVRSAMLLAAAFPEMRGQATALADKLNELARVMTDIRTEGERLKAETQRLNDMRTRLAGLMEVKKQSLSDRQAELTQVRAAAADIARSVGDLNEMIARLDQAVREKAPGLAEYEEEVRRQQAAEVTTAAGTPLAGAAAPPAATTPPPEGGDRMAMISPPQSTAVVELAPAAKGAQDGNFDRLKPRIAFHLAKGTLPLPAQGRRVLSFGDKTQFGGQSKGLVIETRPFAQVTSPSDGWIVYAGEFRSYGQLLIINAGGGYHILVAGLSQIDVEPGQFVLAGEPVGTMSGSPSPGQGNAQIVAQSGAQFLYLEIRKDSQPIDPDPWWADQKVQG